MHLTQKTIEHFHSTFDSNQSKNLHTFTTNGTHAISLQFDPPFDCFKQHAETLDNIHIPERGFIHMIDGEPKGFYDTAMGWLIYSDELMKHGFQYSTGKETGFIPYFKDFGNKFTYQPLIDPSGSNANFYIAIRQILSHKTSIKLVSQVDQYTYTTPWDTNHQIDKKWVHHLFQISDLSACLRFFDPAISDNPDEPIRVTHHPIGIVLQLAESHQATIIDDVQLKRIPNGVFHIKETSYDWLEITYFHQNQNISLRVTKQCNGFSKSNFKHDNGTISQYSNDPIPQLEEKNRFFEIHKTSNGKYITIEGGRTYLLPKKGWISDRTPLGRWLETKTNDPKLHNKTTMVPKWYPLFEKLDLQTSDDPIKDSAALLALKDNMTFREGDLKFIDELDNPKLNFLKTQFDASSKQKHHSDQSKSSRASAYLPESLASKISQPKPSILTHTMLPSAVVLSAIFVSTSVISIPAFTIALMTASALGALALQLAIYQTKCQPKADDGFMQNPWLTHNALAFGLAAIAYFALMANPLSALIVVASVMTLAPLATVMHRSYMEGGLFNHASDSTHSPKTPMNT